MLRNLTLLLLVTALYSCKTQDDGLEITNLDRIELSLASDTEESFRRFNLEFEVNPEKWGPHYRNAYIIKSLTDSVLRIIHTQEIGNMEVQDIINSIESKIDDCNLHDEYNLLKRNQRFKYWRSQKYKNSQRPFLAIDIRSIVNDVLDEIVVSVESGSYVFNVVRPIQIHSANTVRVGEMYIAHVGVLAYDSTMVPKMLLDDIYLDIQDGVGIYRAISNIPGKKHFGGSIVIENNKHELDTLEYDFYYNVE